MANKKSRRYRKRASKRILQIGRGRRDKALSRATKKIFETLYRPEPEEESFEEYMRKQNELASGECDICYQKQKLWSMSCNHKICEDCFNQLKYPLKCPFCRRLVSDRLTIN